MKEKLPKLLKPHPQLQLEIYTCLMRWIHLQESIAVNQLCQKLVHTPTVGSSPWSPTIVMDEDRRISGTKILKGWYTSQMVHCMNRFVFMCPAVYLKSRASRVHGCNTTHFCGALFKVYNTVLVMNLLRTKDPDVEKMNLTMHFISRLLYSIFMNAR